ncbi:hypothetical protein CDL12_18254 [Handroanthus impetiginosus]|uniref:Disease resistance R13L4/SHOC-2-like LRR domain-containing protein n=1 Tax=Handroanthus impetiginosus TaxID=429701 RepID=A0A2G9GV55_9LAMI|nr:hypothetical protein CDL12_18254 [Handroanthus impetiginosus]
MPAQNFVKSFQACLVGEGLISYEDFVEKKDLENVNEHTLGKRISIDDLEKIHLLKNVSEQTLDFKLGWFSRMKNVNLLYLGRWSASSEDHIEVEDTAFLEGLENMKYLKFLSLQRVWNIISLPESISQLKNLKILDLRACLHLERLPEEIGLIKSLTHLDMSECHLLSYMPKTLSSLVKLKVLKGFAVGIKIWKSSRELGDLRKLENLIELSIHTVLEKFPDKDHVKALEELKELKKLKITWRGYALRAENGHHSTSNGSKPTVKLPSKVEKLDLEHFPMSKIPSWWGHLNLKKLYIRGGKFSDLGQYQDWNVKEKYTWKVETLHLKYLSDIELDWKQLQELFPDLVYLDQVNCPKLTFVPCDANGL